MHCKKGNPGVDDNGPDFALDGAGFSAGGRPILRRLSLRLAAGRLHALVGPNGSGKSTFLKLLARQLLPDAGAIRLGSRPLPDFGSRAFAREVAFMPQFTPATDGMTVKELVALGRFAWHGALGRSSPRDRAAVEAAIERCDLVAFARRSVDELSGGERQRAWIAMMLAQESRWLLLDEATSALDVGHQADILDLIAALTRERGVGVVAVLHDINMAARVADEILALDSGNLVFRGGPADVMRPEVLKPLFGPRVDVLPAEGPHPALAYLR
ncbi:ABC transporter ATP-binding protein [uncultured Pleomorphomonas sp.]|uniref:ABC transporter ATP-binding protein n=1 Tax=uncultured Pleomorphomonas sp. TaxID=442121 RepID=UPI00258BA380|nr:ABC transporter ATP-binding protein [uncultured Pleomorphomonas sp.]